MPVLVGALRGVFNDPFDVLISGCVLWVSVMSSQVLQKRLQLGPLHM